MRTPQAVTAALAGTALAFLALGACSSAPASINARGTVTVDYTTAGGDDLSDGSQVVIVNSSGTVIGNGTLTLRHSGAGPFNIGQEDQFTFAVTVPDGQQRYGIQVGGTGHGTVWQAPAQMKSGPKLTLDESTGGL